MNKVLDWFTKYRLQLGVTIGTLNIITGIDELLNDNIGLGLMFVCIGIFIVYDGIRNE